MNAFEQTCYHCGLPNEQGLAFPVTINGKDRHMCCPGCQAVAESIVAMGLDDYYQFREKLPEVSPKNTEVDLDQLLFYDRENVQDKYIQEKSGTYSSISLMVSGIVCSACTWLIETRISKLNGVSQITVNQSTNRAMVSWDANVIQLSDILKAITSLGYQAQPYDRAAKEQALIKEKKRFLQRLAIAGLGMMQVMMYSLGFYLDTNQEMSQGNWQLLRWVSLLISTPVVFYAASPFYISAYNSLKNRAVNMDVPVTFAIFAAWIASTYATFVGAGEVYFDSVSMFVFFLLTGRYLQMIAIHKSGRALEERLGSQPETAIRIRDNKQEQLLLDDIEPGDVLLVKPATQIPCDGILLAARAEIDESILTGESTPILKYQHQKLPAGGINTGDAFKIKVTERVENSTLAGIIRLLQSARETKPRIQKLADKVASFFVMGILLLTISTGIYWQINDPAKTFEIVLAVLVVTCPCALALATPVAITTALGHMTSKAVLVNRSSALFNLNHATDFVFDKTGTLTTGRFTLKEMNNLSNQTDEEILSIVAAMEFHSEHPIASAFEDINTGNLNVTELQRIPGVGLQAFVNEQSYQIGNAVLLDKQPIKQHEKSDIVLYLVKNKHILAEFILTTEIRAEAIELINILKSKKLGIHILSGDKSRHVEHLANVLALDMSQVRSGITPEEKLNYIESLQATGAMAVMVGDGLNDSPAMAAASVSIAMTEATDITKVNADMILMNESLLLIQRAYELARKTRTIIKQNIGWAVGYNLLGVPLAMAGFITPWIAALGMSLSSLIVVMNALRLSNKKQAANLPT